MGYDVTLFQLQDGEAPQDGYARVVSESAAEEINRGPVVDELERHKEQLAAAMEARIPPLRRFRFDHRQIAAIEGVEEAEARRKWRHVELNVESVGIQIVLFDKQAGASVRYGRQEQGPMAAFGVFWACLDVLGQEGGYCIWDPQLGRPIDTRSDTDWREAFDRYTATFAIR